MINGTKNNVWYVVGNKVIVASAVLASLRAVLWFSQYTDLLLTERKDHTGE